MMNSRLLAKLLKPVRPLPPPDPQCRTYDIGGVVLMLRNHERIKAISANLHKGKK